MKMATLKSRPTGRRESILSSPSLFTGSYDDASFTHTSPQLTKPINIPHTSTSIHSKRPTFFSSYYDMTVDDNSAVLDDSDVHSEDELPPSPMRRHSGAMSISHENLSSCFDREALRRETAAHRDRQQREHQQQDQQHKEAFALHEEWDCEVDGPHMALWTPGASASSSTMASPPVGTASNKRRRTQQQQPHQVSFIEGPMMCLWEP